MPSAFACGLSLASILPAFARGEIGWAIFWILTLVVNGSFVIVQWRRDL